MNSNNKRTVLIVDDEKAFRELYTETLKSTDINTLSATSAEEALSIITEKNPDMVICDVKMSGMDGIALFKETVNLFPELPFLFITAYANVKDAVNSLKIGAVDYLEKPVDLNELRDSVLDILNISTNINLPKSTTKGIIAESEAMQVILNDAYHAAQSDVSILITGESGTGKEVLAQFIHNNSPRHSKPLVTVNCASIPVNILGSELFGHEKGAFSGAIAKRDGKFRTANNGTLFLDEIGDMPLKIQPALLRAIENKTIAPIGSDKELTVDFRLIAATNCPLEKFIEEGKFRKDLFYRLNIIALKIPPLRERQEDIVPLARFFLKKQDGGNKKLSHMVERILLNYDWPGNIRELANCIQRAKILSRTELIMPEHLPPNIKQAKYSTKKNVPYNNQVISLEQSELTMIKKALDETNGNQTKAAKLLGISRRTLINKMKKI
jgi:DNA-binding NtrC family response regulator